MKAIKIFVALMNAAGAGIGLSVAIDATRRRMYEPAIVGAAVAFVLMVFAVYLALHAAARE